MDLQRPGIRNLMVLLLSLSTTLHAAVVDEVTLLHAMPADLFRQMVNLNGRPDANGLFGKNISGTFVADNQRRAMGYFASGVALNDQDDIADAWRALDATYQRQQPSGGFGTGTNGSEVESMSFFMSWSNHGLWVLMNSSFSDAYQSRVQALLPKVELAMDRMMAADAIAAMWKANNGSPNRSCIMANLYGLGSLVLGQTSSAAKIAAYRARGKFWIDNAFVNDKLFRSSDGVYTEGGGYDTSYQGVALALSYYYMLAFPNDVVDGQGKSLKAGQWLVKRIEADGTCDCTYNRRSGPNNLSGDVKGSDFNVMQEALLYWSAQHGGSDGYDAVRRMTRAEVNGRPPVVFSPLIINATVGVPFTYDLLLSNAGLSALSGSFDVALNGLPAWLLRSGAYGYAPSTGTQRLSGIPLVPGSVTVQVTARNDFGTSPPAALTINIAPASATNAPPVVSAGPDRVVTLPSSATLDGTVSDDGLPSGSFVSQTWTKLSGPGTVTFTSGATARTTASFSLEGTYVLGLTASDGALSANDTMTVVANPTASLPPAVAAPATGPSSPVTGTSAALTVLGGPALEEPSYIYTWSTVSGPAGGTAIFSPNGSNAAHRSTITVDRAGTWIVQVEIRNSSSGAMAISGPVSIMVAQTLASLNPGTSGGATSIAVNGTVGLTLGATDQFGNAMPPPASTWTSTVGSVSAGAFTAPANPGVATLTASGGGMSSTLVLTVTTAAAATAPNTSSSPHPRCGFGGGIALVCGSLLSFLLILFRPHHKSASSD